MPVQKEVLLIAYRLVHQAGEQAPAYASRWANQLLEAGDLEESAKWMGVTRACKSLLAQEAFAA
jgi:hypothetical protein